MSRRKRNNTEKKPSSNQKKPLKPPKPPMPIKSQTINENFSLKTNESDN